MKKLFLIVFVLLLGSGRVFSQDTGTPDSFRQRVMPEYGSYFSNAVITGNGRLTLLATDAYTVLGSEARATIMAGVLKNLQDSLVLVRYGNKGEAWGTAGEPGNARLLDEFDFNPPILARPVLADIRIHPWFFYIGEQIGGNNQHIINLALNLRVGFFMLKDRWDLATTFSAGLSGTTVKGGTSTGNVNIGLMSRVHFPIKKIRLSPNIGGEIAMGLYGTNPWSVTGSVVLGVSWFVGIGNLDIGIHIGNIVTAIGGYTMSPTFKRNKE